jgi:hypothetical protein
VPEGGIDGNGSLKVALTLAAVALVELKWRTATAAAFLAESVATNMADLEVLQDDQKGAENTAQSSAESFLNMCRTCWPRIFTESACRTRVRQWAPCKVVSPAEGLKSLERRFGADPGGRTKYLCLKGA